MRHKSFAIYGSTPKPWCLGFLLRIGHEAENAAELTLVSVQSFQRAENDTTWLKAPGKQRHSYQARYFKDVSVIA